MGKREEQKLKRRQQILDTGLRLFVTRGYHGTTIRDIAKELDMSVGLLFHYFANKEAVYLELLQFAAQGVGFVNMMQFADMTPLEMLSAMSTAIFDSFSTYPQSAEYFLLVKQALTAEYLTDEMRAVVASMNSIEAIVPLIVHGQELGELKSGDPLALSMAFFSAIQGTAESLVCFPDLPIPDALWFVDIVRK